MGQAEIEIYWLRTRLQILPTQSLNLTSHGHERARWCVKSNNVWERGIEVKVSRPSEHLKCSRCAQRSRVLALANNGSHNVARRFLSCVLSLIKPKCGVLLKVVSAKVYPDTVSQDGGEVNANLA